MVLKSKIITVLTVVLLLTIGTSAAVVLRVQTKMLIDSKLKDVEVLSGLIESSITDAMESGRTANVQKILENIGKNQEITTLRILSTSGGIMKSKSPDEIGLKAKEYTLTSNDHQKQPILNEESITYFKAIPNKPECYGCHSKEVKTAGIIQIKYDMSRSKNDIMSIKRFLVFSNILSVLVVAIILSIMFSKLILKPLKNVLSAMKEFEAGNWEAKAHATGNDELGVISQAFNKMTDEVRGLHEKSLRKEKELSKIKLDLDHKRKLEELNAQLQFKVKEVETANKTVVTLSKEVKSKNVELEKMVERLRRINEVGKMLSSIIETDELIKLIIKTTAELLSAGKGAIYLKRNEKPSLTLKYHHGIGVEDFGDVALDFKPIYSELMDNGSPVIIHEKDSVKKNSYGIDNSAIGVPLKMKGQVIGAMLLEDKLDGASFTDDELELLTTLANQAMVSIENAWLYERVKNNYFATIQSLVNALEANDRYTKGHSERVRYLSVELGKYIGLDYREIEVLEHAAILHDIGKIGIDSMVLHKEGKLTANEYGLVKAHPLIGDEILGPIDTLAGVRTTIIQHHERYDGRGYPYGIPGDEISLKARILAVIDTFDAMLTDRPYRRSLTLFRAKEELKHGAGSQFDPYVVNAFLDMLESREEELLMTSGYNLSLPE
ncbi:MAG: metal dependent phosphohydrolase [Nitrospirae bacterium]|nr:MAG: metal dependent phosphohydrolase [Nitrospirota bacterium]